VAERNASAHAAAHAELFERGVMALERIAICLEQGPLTEAEKIGRYLASATPPTRDRASDQREETDK
jgi:hypothetical protein